MVFLITCRSRRKFAFAIPNFEIIISDLFILELIYSIAELSTFQNHLRRVPFVTISDFCVVLYFGLDYCFCHIIFYSFLTSFYPNSSSILFCFRLLGSTAIKLQFFAVTFTYSFYTKYSSLFDIESDRDYCGQPYVSLLGLHATYNEQILSFRMFRWSFQLSMLVVRFRYHICIHDHMVTI